MREVRTTSHHRLLYAAATGAAALTMLAALVAALLWPQRAALAQSAPTGAFVHDAAADFSGGCAILTDTVVSTASGGEIRLRATVEDYFDDPATIGSTWVFSLSNVEAGGSPVPPIVANGVVTLDG